MTSRCQRLVNKVGVVMVMVMESSESEREIARQQDRERERARESGREWKVAGENKFRNDTQILFFGFFFNN